MPLNLHQKKVIIIAHVLTTVPAIDLKEYFLKKNVDELLYIGHPLFFVKGRPGSHYLYYKKGKLIRSKQLPPVKLPSLIQYVFDIVISLWWILLFREKWDMIIALDNLNTFAALLLRSIQVTNKVVYYTIDFVPQRFQNKTLNNIYHLIDKCCVLYADSTWNVSSRIAEGREKIRALSQKKYIKQITVPIGIWTDHFRKYSRQKRNLHTLVYAGGLLPHHGIQTVIQAIPFIVKKIPDFTFAIMGMGAYENDLRELVKKLHVEKYVVFKGYFESHNDVEKALCTYGAGVALYTKSLDKWSYYADPSKIKTYLAAGLPILTTPLTHIAKDLEKAKCGIIVEENPQSVAEGIVSIMKDTKRQEEMSKNSKKIASEFDWVAVFDKAVGEVI